MENLKNWQENRIYGLFVNKDMEIFTVGSDSDTKDWITFDNIGDCMRACIELDIKYWGSWNYSFGVLKI